MASSSKKRRISKSPRQTDAKRPRHVSSSSSIHSQRKSVSQQPVRAKSVFRGDRDPYLPKRDNNARFLPASDDWAFRVKVVSSATDLDNDVFKRAVQGLVKICFPEGVLEELGIQVLEAHMHQDNAPEENITKTTEIFRSEMVHRVTWMLAEYLDSSSKVDATVSSVMAASAKLHGNKIGDDVLGYVLSSLNDLRTHAPSNSTELLASGVGLTEPVNEDDATLNSEVSTMIGDDAADSSDASSGEELAPPPKKDKKRKNHRSRKQIQDHDHTIRDTSVPSATPVESIMQSREEQPLEDKERKVSSTWRWDINPEGLSHDALLQIFKRTSDLFAFHALPIAHRRLGTESKPKRRQLRKDIQKMLNDTGDDEYVKWSESLRKLHSGDLTMMDRIENLLTNNYRDATTPAPITRVVSQNSNSLGRQQDTVSLPLPDVTLIKREATINHDDVAESLETIRQPQKGQVTANSTTVRQFPVHQNKASTAPDRVQSASDVRSLAAANHAPSQGILTPIVDLLWGDKAFTYHERLDVIQAIELNLNKRTTAESVQSYSFSGSTKSYPRAGLQNALIAVYPVDHARFDPVKARKRVEEQLLPWVMAHLSKFPELCADAFVFANIMPYLTHVLDLVIPTNISLDRTQSQVNGLRIKEFISRRGLPTGTLRGPASGAIPAVLGDPSADHATKRGVLERKLRYVAFAHRSKFPELRSSALVAMWERETGQKW